MAADTVTVISSFQNRQQAEQAIEALRNEDFAGAAIAILQSTGDALVNELKAQGFGEEDVRLFADEAKDGRTLLKATVPDDQGERVSDILERFETEGDVEQAKWRSCRSSRKTFRSRSARSASAACAPAPRSASSRSRSA